MNLSQGVAADIDRRRELAGLTPRAFAYQLDISEASLSHRKHGRVDWTWAEIEKAAEILGTSVSAIIRAAERTQDSVEVAS